jgi:hypothetical protein
MTVLHLDRPVQEDLARRKRDHQRFQYLLCLHGSMRKVLYHPPTLRADSPSRNPPTQTQRSPTVNDLVAEFNSEAKRLDLSLELSVMSELGTTSSDGIPSTLSPLPTVDEHEAMSFNNKIKATDHSASTHPPGKIVPKRLSLVSHIGNHVKRGVNNRVASLSNITIRRLSPIKATIRLPPSSTEALDTSTVVIPHAESPS